MRTKREAKALAAQAAAPTTRVQPTPTTPQTEFRVAPIENWEAFTLPEVQRVLSYWRPSTDVPSWSELVLQVTQGKAIVLAAGAGQTIQGLAIILLPQNALWPLPYIAHLRIEPDTPPRLKNALIDTGVAMLKAKGYTECWAINAAGYSDELWSRAFRRAGRLLLRGSVYTITF